MFYKIFNMNLVIKLYFVLLMASTVMCTSKEEDFLQEEPCSEVGGQCLLKSDCSNSIPDKYLNLCPEQKEQGVECCHGNSLVETSCQKLGGECYTFCLEDDELPAATDCRIGKTCCLHKLWVPKVPED